MSKATGPKYVVQFRRRRSNITNYKKRLALVKSNLVRIVIRKTSKNILIQFIQFSEKGDKTLISTRSTELNKYNWHATNNTPTAYLTGLLAGNKALRAGIKEAILDIGLHAPSKGSCVFSGLKGIIDSGVKSNAGEGLFSEERIKGIHITKYAESIKNTDKYNSVFASYLKKGIKPEELTVLFEKTKGTIKAGA
ncbi:50S ribosomal protein L18 [Candidatus Micrarchaeota archaeon]|nr:50S ribosomal protein L18 [Candidatus Micrarchaeota archaeon]